MFVTFHVLVPICVSMEHLVVEPSYLRPNLISHLKTLPIVPLKSPLLYVLGQPRLHTLCQKKKMLFM